MQRYTYFSDQDDLDWDPRHDDGAHYSIRIRRRRDSDADDPGDVEDLD